MKEDIGLAVFLIAIVIASYFLDVRTKYQRENDERSCLYKAELMKLDDPAKERRAVAFCMQQKGWE